MNLLEAVSTAVGLLVLGSLFLAVLSIPTLREEVARHPWTKSIREKPGQVAADAIETGGVSLLSAADPAQLERAAAIPPREGSSRIRWVLAALASGGVSLIAGRSDASQSSVDGSGPAAGSGA